MRFYVRGSARLAKLYAASFKSVQKSATLLCAADRRPPISSNAPFTFLQPWASRYYSTIERSQSELDRVNDLFAEARDLIEDARDEAETVYFNEAHEDAKRAVREVLDKYYAVLNDLSEEEKRKLQRSMGLKIEQLKAELEGLDLLHS